MLTIVFAVWKLRKKYGTILYFSGSHCGNDGVDPYALSTLFIQAKKTPYGYFLYPYQGNHALRRKDLSHSFKERNFRPY